MKKKYKNQNTKQIINSRFFFEKFKNKIEKTDECVFIVDNLKAS